MTRTITEIDLGAFKLRFDPKDIRVSIDGDRIDVGARIKSNNLLLENQLDGTKLWESQEKLTD